MTIKIGNDTYSIYNGMPVSRGNAKSLATMYDDYTSIGETDDFKSCISNNKDNYKILAGIYYPTLITDGIIDNNSETRFKCYGSQEKPREYDYIFEGRHEGNGDIIENEDIIDPKLQPIRSSKQNLKKHSNIPNGVMLSACSNGANISNLCRKGDNSKQYINPLGQVKNIEAGDNIRNTLNKTLTRNQQLSNTKEKHKLAQYELIVWSIMLAIISLFFVSLLKNVRK